MLLRFAASNHLSLRERQELSLIASKLKDSGANLIQSDTAGVGDVLPAVVIYGGNASGKSNVVEALNFMRRSILSSHSSGEPGGGVPRTPFALDPEAVNEPSIFDIDFVLNKVRFHYGFSASSERFESEWLYHFPNNRRQLLFERTGDVFRFGRALKGKNRIIADLTRPNSLFVSAAAQNDHEELSPIQQYFRTITTTRSVYVGGPSASRTLRKKDIDCRVISFLERIGTGIVNFRWNETEKSELSLELQSALYDALNRSLGTKVPIQFEETDLEIELAHRGFGDAEVFLDINTESTGTRRLLVILTQAFHALDQGSTILMDEMDASLHTQICEAILHLFSRNVDNIRGSQLIATTHDTNLLSCAGLRRDQIWFTEKDRNGATHLYPLTDISTRPNDNLEKGYLQGRFGAIPFAGSASILFE